MYSFPNLEPVYCSMFRSNCCFLTCIQISQEAGKVVWYFHLFQNFPQLVLIHTVKGFGIVKKSRSRCFFSGTLSLYLWSSGCWQFNLWSSAFSTSRLNVWKFTVHILLKPGLENFEHYFASVWGQCNCVVVWIFFGIVFFGIGMKINLFQSYGHCWIFKICWHIECSTLTASSFRTWNNSWNSITSTSFVCSDAS